MSETKKRLLGAADMTSAILVSIFCGAVLEYMAEAIARDGFSQAFHWIVTAPGAFVCSAGLIACTFLTFLCLARRMSSAFGMTAALTLTCAGVQYYKLLLKGDVFQFGDVLLVREAVQITDHFQLIPTVTLIACIAICIALVLLLRRRRIRIHLALRAVLCALMASATIFAAQGLPDRIARMTGTAEVVIPQDYYETNGLAAGLIKTMPLPPEEPEGYSEASVREALNALPAPEADAAQSVLPDIFFIMNETLYDLQNIDEISLTEDPLAYLKTCQASYAGAELLSPSYGGNTCQVEYEVLTGYPARNSVGMAYQTVPLEGAASVVGALDASGYYTLALHPYTRTFYERDCVYAQMGFDDMAFEDDMAQPLRRISWQVTDDCLYDELIERYEHRDKSRPFFAHVVTIQNHGEYDFEWSGAGSVRSADETQDPQARAQLETYASLLRESDAALKKLISYFERQKRPVLLVLWGDHAPNLSLFGVDTSSYEEDAQRYGRLYCTPLLIYNNYGLDVELPEVMSSYRLGAFALRLANVPLDAYLTRMGAAGVPDSNDALVFEADHFRWKPDASEEAKRTFDAIRLCQYDRLYGERYSERRVE